MVAWFLGLEDVLSWLLVEGKRDAITVDMNGIALLRETQLVVVVKLEGNDMNFEELMGLDNRFKFGKHFGIVVNDEVLHRVVTVVKESTFVDQVVKVIIDTKEDCTKSDGCSGKMVCDDT
nr:hypothetical protein [Tanacetum cinerariifolium]